MSPVQSHVARERAAVLLGGLVRYGVRDLAQVTAVPPLAEVLPAQATLESLGAAHHRVFSLEAPPVVLEGPQTDPQRHPSRALICQELATAWSPRAPPS